ncbi:MAG: hypothetical protein ACL93V_09970 [Candidatus Electrothrix sp. YB6]
MNTLPVLTILFWAVFLIGSWFLPGVFRQDMIQFPITVILSVFLSVSFWELAKAGKTFFALSVVGIFCFNVSVLLFAVQGSYSARQALAGELNKGIEPGFAQYVETAVSGDKRRLAAQIIYRQHGTALPYKDGNGSYTLYSPTETDKEKHRKNFFAANDLKVRSMALSSSLLTAVVLLLLHVALFTGLLIFLVLYDSRRGNGQHGSVGT